MEMKGRFSHLNFSCKIQGCGNAMHALGGDPLRCLVTLHPTSPRPHFAPLS